MFQEKYRQTYRDLELSKEDQERILVVLNETNKLLKNPKTITKIETSFKNNVKESIKKGN